MIFKVISVMTSGVGGQNWLKGVEDSLNMAAEDGYQYLFHFQPDSSKLVIIMGKSRERRGRPKKMGEEATEIED